MTSSFGRFLDALAYSLGVCNERTYDGEPAMKMESLLARGKRIDGFETAFPSFAQIFGVQRRFAVCEERRFGDDADGLAVRNLFSDFRKEGAVLLLRQFRHGELFIEAESEAVSEAHFQHALQDPAEADGPTRRNDPGALQRGDAVKQF